MLGCEELRDFGGERAVLTFEEACNRFDFVKCRRHVVLFSSHGRYFLALIVCVEDEVSKFCANVALVGLCHRGVADSLLVDVPKRDKIDQRRADRRVKAGPDKWDRTSVTGQSEAGPNETGMHGLKHVALNVIQDSQIS